MKKIVLIFVAMLAMVQLNTATAAEAPDAAGEENNMTYDHPFRSDAKSHWTVTTNGFYFGMGLKHNWETINNSFEIGLLNIAAVNYNSLHGQNISLGVGIHHRSYSMKRPNMLLRDDVADAVIVGSYPKVDDNNIKNRSSNLNLWTVQFPLIFSQRIAGKLHISLAGILNWNAYARVDNHYELNKIEHDTKFKGLKNSVSTAVTPRASSSRTATVPKSRTLGPWVSPSACNPWTEITDITERTEIPK